MEERQCLMEGHNDIRAKTEQIFGGATSIDRMGTLPKTTNKKEITIRKWQQVLENSYQDSLETKLSFLGV